MRDAKASETVATDGVGGADPLYPCHLKRQYKQFKDDSKPGRFMTVKQVYGGSSHEIINTHEDYT